jgi:hypothetical protein
MKDNIEIAKDYTDWHIKTGGFATGMTMRDYFAAKALQNFRDQIGSQSDQEWFDQMAEGAYRMANSMLKERAK